MSGLLDDRCEHGVMEGSDCVWCGKVSDPPEAYYEHTEEELQAAADARGEELAVGEPAPEPSEAEWLAAHLEHVISDDGLEEMHFDNGTILTNDQIERVIRELRAVRVERDEPVAWRRRVPHSQAKGEMSYWRFFHRKPRQLIGDEVEPLYTARPPASDAEIRETAFQLAHDAAALVAENDGLREAMGRIEEMTGAKWGDHTPLIEVLDRIRLIARDQLTVGGPGPPASDTIDVAALSTEENDDRTT